LGVADTAERMHEAGFDPANWVVDMLITGCSTFYQYEQGRTIGVYNPAKKGYDPIRPSTNRISLKDKKSAGNIVIQNPGAKLVDLGDGIACVEFQTKMNALDDDIFNLTSEALDRAEAGDFAGLIIGNDADNFSVGANLGMVLLAAHMGMWDQLTQAIEKLQNLNMRIRYANKPVVIAPAGLTLGGGSEMMMHASKVVAGVELYAGLVEVGVGVIPAGAGTKEMLRRVINPPMRTKNADPLPYLQRLFEQIGTAQVGTSAEEVRHLGLLSDSDRIVMNRSHLIAEAKKEVLHLVNSGYTPPLPERIYAAGRDALAALRVGIFMYWKAGQISDYDRVVAEKLAYVLVGGELSSASWVAEQYILDLEKEAFLSLCGEEKTRARIKHMLDTGKPLRN
jgi:3-hydroxyacyl-CoA dehydrogenase